MPLCWADLDVSGSTQAVTLWTKIGNSETITWSAIFLSPGHQVWEVLLSGALKHYWHTWRHTTTKNYLFISNVLFHYMDESITTWMNPKQILYIKFKWNTYSIALHISLVLYNQTNYFNTLKLKYFVRMCAYVLTLLFLTDLLHQASDLDVLFPFFTSRGRCTAAF